jgi:hypothetical protein
MASPMLFTSTVMPVRPTKVDIVEILWKQVVELFDEVEGDDMLMEHLHAKLNTTMVRMQSIKATIKIDHVHEMKALQYYTKFRMVEAWHLVTKNISSSFVEEEE